MSNLIKEKAREYLKAELSVIPTKEDKRPAITWKPYQSERMKEDEVEALFSGSNVEGLAVICGAISGNLEVIDVDTKHDTTGSLWAELKDKIRQTSLELFYKLVIAQTKSGGYHIYYRCSSIAGNLKLANKLNNEVLIETRGEGGYVIAPPTNKYTYISGEPNNIPTITPEEREVLFNISKSFNELKEKEYKKPTTKKTTSTTYSSTTHRSINNYIKNIVTAVEDYNNRGDVLSLLDRHGWRILNTEGERTYVLRPGEATSQHSGNFHSGLRVLKVFSTSTGLDSDRGYSPAQAYCFFECNNREDILEDRLREEGYGFYPEGATIKATQVKTEKIKVEVVNTVNRESSVISTPGESLKIENIQTAVGDEVVITSPGSEAQEEILKTITLIQDAGKRVYIKEGDYHYTTGAYLGNRLLEEYLSKGDQSGEIDYRERDLLRDKVVELRSKLSAQDRIDFNTHLVKPLEAHGFSEPILSELEENYKTAIQEAKRNKKVDELKRKIDTIEDRGEIIKVLKAGLTEIEAIPGKGLLPQVSYSSIIEEITTLPPAYSTGYSSLDRFAGFNPGAITLIAGRPSHGKTTFMFNCLLQVCEKYPDEKFYFFTYEEPLKNIAIKILNRLTATSLSPYFTEVKDLVRPTNYEFLKHYIKEQRTDIREVEEGKRKLRELIDSRRLTIVDKNYTVEDLSKLVSYLKQTEKVGALFLDYIQKINTSEKKPDMRTKIAHISAKVLEIAKDTNLPIILGAQLNREAKNKPSLENLKEAGNLEEDANTVLSVYCDAREKEENSEGEEYSKQREVELLIKAQKNREGEVNAKEELIWDRHTNVIKERNNKF